MALSRKRGLMVAAGGLMLVLLLNESLAWITATLLMTPYLPFPHSFWLNYTVLASGQGTVLLLAAGVLLWGWIAVIGLAGRHLVNQCARIVALGGLMASELGNGLYSVLGGGPLSLSPLQGVQLLVFRHQLADPLWCWTSYGVAFGLVALFGSSALVRVIQTNDQVYGRARFANLWDLLRWKMLRAGEGALLLGRYWGIDVYAFGFECLLILAPSGGGKTSSFGIPNLLRFKGSSISTDIAFELYNKTATYLRQQHASVYLFAPTRKRTHRFNIFTRAINMAPEYRYGEIQRIMALIIPEENNSKNSVWTQAARRLLESLAAYLISTTQHCSLGDLAEICCRPDFEQWLRNEVLNNDAVDVQFKVNASSYLGIPADETRGGVKFNMDTFLGLYLDPIVRAATQNSDFNLMALRQTKMAVFVGISESQLNRLSPLITMFFEEACRCMTENEPDINTEPLPVFFNIDEFGNLPPIHQIRRNLTTMRKFRVRIAVYFQYKDQSGNYYSDKELKAFFNVKNKLIFTQSDIEDAEYGSIPTKVPNPPQVLWY